jgi:hemerythrin superfamily protein
MLRSEQTVGKAKSRLGLIVPKLDGFKENTMNALELLKADHEVVAGYFAEVEESSEDKHPAIFKKIKAELDVHAHIEETIFYPKLKADGDKELVDIVLEGIEEHRQVKMFLRELDALSDDSEKFEPKLTVLMEDVEHHVEEEENEMFKLVEAQFDETTLEELGAQMEEEKAAFKKSNAASA